MGRVLIDVLWGICLVGMVTAAVVEWRTGRTWSYHRMAWGLFFAIATIVTLIDRAFAAAGISAVGLALNAVWARNSWRRGQ